MTKKLYICNFCGAPGLEWKQNNTFRNPRAWRLEHADGTPHICEPYEQYIKERHRIVNIDNEKEVQRTTNEARWLSMNLRKQTNERSS